METLSSTNGLQSGTPTLKVARLSEWFYRKIQTWGLIYKTVRGITKSVRTPKSQVLRAPKNIQTYKTLRTHTVRNHCFIKSQSAYKCAQLNQLHAPPCTRPFLTINGQCKWPHECDLHIKQTQMPVYVLLETMAEVLRKAKKRNFTEVEVETLQGPKSSFVRRSRDWDRQQQKADWVAKCCCSSELCQ